MRAELPLPPAGADDPVELIGRAANGNLAAFEQLYRRYSPKIYGLCLRLTGVPQTAEDCTQDCFIHAWRSLSRFEGRSAFGTWLHAIAVRSVLSRRKGLRIVHEVPEPDSGLPDMPDPSSEAPLDLERAIAGLPEAARHVLVLVGIYGYSHAEAANALGVAEGTCKAQLHRARALLAQAMGMEQS